MLLKKVPKPWRTLTHDRDKVWHVCIAPQCAPVRQSSALLSQGTDRLGSETNPHPELTIEFMQPQSFPTAVIPGPTPIPPTPADASYTTCTQPIPYGPLLVTAGAACRSSVLVRKGVSISDRKTRRTERHQTWTRSPVQTRLHAPNPDRSAGGEAETSPRIVPCPASQRPEILNQSSADHEVRQNTSGRREPQTSYPLDSCGSPPTHHKINPRIQALCSVFSPCHVPEDAELHEKTGGGTGGGPWSRAAALPAQISCSVHGSGCERQFRLRCMRNCAIPCVVSALHSYGLWSSGSVVARVGQA